MHGPVASTHYSLGQPKPALWLNPSEPTTSNC